MLVLSRKMNEEIVISNSIRIRIVDVRSDKVRIGVEAPREVTVHRREIQELINNQRTQNCEENV